MNVAAKWQFSLVQEGQDKDQNLVIVIRTIWEKELSHSPSQSFRQGKRSKIIYEQVLIKKQDSWGPGSGEGLGQGRCLTRPSEDV